MARKLQMTLAGLAVGALLPGAAMGQASEEEAPPPARAPGSQSSPRAPQARPAFDVAPELSEEARRAREVLEASIQSIEALTGLTAKVRTGATDGLSAFMPEAEGTLLVLREVAEAEPRRGVNPFSFRVTGDGKVTGKSEETLEFDVIFKDRRFHWLDDEAKESRVRFERQAGRETKVRLAKELMLREVFDASPYAEAMRNANIELLEQETVAGVLCDVVKSPQAQGARYELYFIGAEDRLPRRFERVAETEIISGSMFVELGNLRVNPSVSDSSLALTLPEGYAPDPSPAMIREAPLVGQDPEQTPSRRVARPPAQAWSLKSAAGEEVSLAELKGSVVVFDFWGTWLPEDRRPVHEMQSLANQFEGRPVRVFSMNFRERDQEKAKQFMAEAGASYPLLLDADEVGRRYGVRQFPTIYVVGVEGEVVDVVRGYDPESTFQTLARTIDEYLDERANAGGEGEAATGEAGGSDSTGG